MMRKQLECIKIKDGLYFGSKAVAYDLEFLWINKFAYIVNCALELPNIFEQHGIKYLKFKIPQAKIQHILDESLKRLKKIKKIIEQAQQNGMCCLVHCTNGGNRSLFMITAYLMDRFKWKLCKAIQFLQSKSIFISLTEDNIEELANLQITLMKDYRLSSDWTGPFIDEQEELLAKTFANTSKQPAPKTRVKNQLKKQLIKEEVQVERSMKKVQWLDRIEKEQRKQKKRIQVEKKQIERSKDKFNQEEQEEIVRKQPKAHAIIQPKDSTDLQKRFKKRGDQQLDPQIKKKIEEAQILQLIKKSGKFKKEVVKELTTGEMAASQLQITPLNKVTEEEPDKQVYKLTINNYINPNINIIKSPPQRKKKVHKISHKKDKFTRTYSQKESFKKVVLYDKELVKEKQKEKRNAGNTPIRKERKSQKEKDVKL